MRQVMMNKTVAAIIENISESLSVILLRVFLSLIVLVSVYNGRRLFLESIGRFHRLSGLLHLTLIVYGAINVVNNPDQDDNDNELLLSSSWSYRCFIYDIGLGIMGTITTLSAAKSFPHKTLTNKEGQSGTLAQEAYVTQDEMIEHSFYQMLNTVQATYLHWMTSSEMARDYATIRRLLAIFIVTSPWFLRHYFPIHSFSANWKKNGTNEKTNNMEHPQHKYQAAAAAASSATFTTTTEWLEIRLYQIKKWQYVFYKHVILHGLNISIAFPPPLLGADNSNDGGDDSIVSTTRTIRLPLRKSFRIFWICLQTSYVMEFYMQSLVKRRIISQKYMLVLQRLLMTASSISAILAVHNAIRPELCILSCSLNFMNRGHDVWNVMLASIVAFLTNSYMKA